jgi:exodeoxyribonuclease VII small subunit
MASKKENIESLLQELEEISSSLESGELDLNQSLEKFEKGVKSYKKCKKLIDAAEEKIKVLTESLEEHDI